MPKILFICAANVGRSQMAEAFYNHFTQSNDASSAGTDPTSPIRYPRITDEICQVMSEEGIDISHQRVKTVDRHIAEVAERIFVLCGKEFCPDFLLDSNKVTYWQIDDPHRISLDNIRKIRDQIKEKIKSII